MREFVTYVDAKGHDVIADFVAGLPAPEIAKLLTMLEALAQVDELRMPYFKIFRGFTVTLGELRIGAFRIFAHRLEALPGQERWLLVHVFRKKSERTPHREIDLAIKRIIAYRYEHD